MYQTCACVIHINLHTLSAVCALDLLTLIFARGIHVLREALVLEVELFFFCVSVAPIPTQTKPSKGIYRVYHITYVVHNAGQQGISALR